MDNDKIKKEIELLKNENLVLLDQAKTDLNLQYEEKIQYYEKKIEETDAKISLNNQNYNDKLHENEIEIGKIE